MKTHSVKRFTCVSGAMVETFVIVEGERVPSGPYVPAEAYDLALAALNQQQWCPMETAPRDGSAVFAWRPSWYRPRFVRWVLNYRTGTEFWNDVEEWDHYELETEPPTHWLKLPPVP